MRIARASQMQEIDRRATEDFGIPSSRLMENAGVAMADRILREEVWKRARGVWVLCGPGKNGGDGKVIARRLSENGVDVHLWSSASGKPIPTVEELSGVGLIVDALFGVGLNRPLEGAFRDLVTRVNESRRPVVSVDIPSGLDTDRGIVLGAAIRATHTMTCGLAKPGFFLQDGPGLVGQISVMKIGFPAELEKSVANDVFVIGRPSARRLFPAAKPTANKTGFGRVLVIGGSPGMEGAAILAATAAARIGAGYVTLCTPSAVPFDQKPPDFLSLSWNKLKLQDFSKYQSIVIGPGMGEGADRLAILKRVIASGVKTVVDADALTVLSKTDLKLHSGVVITPHAGELSRLISADSKTIEADRLRFARECVWDRGGLCLLKGFHTVVSNGSRSWIVNAGNSALAKAGTGDVLAGFIGGLMAQGLVAAEAAVLGAYLHGDIADRWVGEGRGSRTLMASDLPGLLARAMMRLR